MRTRTLALLTLVAFVSGCGGQGEPGPIDRKAVTKAFSRIGEPLTIRLDLQAADPDSTASSVDVIYVPASADVPAAPFEVALFDDEDAARERALWMEAVSGGTLDIVRRKNAIMTLRPSVSARQRDKLIATLASL